MLGIGYLEVALMILGGHIIILLLLTSLHERDRIAYDSIDFIYYQPRGLIKYEAGLSIIAPLTEDVSLDYDDAVKSDLLIIQDQLIVDILLNDCCGSTNTVRNLNGRCLIGFLEVLLDLLFISLPTCGMLIISNINHLQNKEFSLNLRYLMK